MDPNVEPQEELEFSQGEKYFSMKEKVTKENRVNLGSFYKKDII